MIEGYEILMVKTLIYKLNKSNISYAVPTQLDYIIFLYPFLGENMSGEFIFVQCTVVRMSRRGWRIRVGG